MSLEEDWKAAKQIAYDTWLPAAFGPDWPEKAFNLDSKFRGDDLIWAFVAGWRYGAGKIEKAPGPKAEGSISSPSCSRP